MKKYFVKINCISICKLILTLCRISLSCFNGGFSEQRRLLCAELHAALNSLSAHQRNLHCVELRFRVLTEFSIINNIYEADKCVAASICDSAYYIALSLDGTIFFTRHLPAQEIGVQEALQYKISAKKRVFAASVRSESFSAAGHRRAVAVYQT